MTLIAQKTKSGKAHLVSGADVTGNTGMCVISTPGLHELDLYLKYQKDVALVEAGIETVLAPLVAALEAIESEEASEYVVEEGSETTPRVAIPMSDNDKDVLAIIEDGDDPSFRWVDGNTLVRLA